MNSLAFWITAMIIIGSASATEDLLASNRLLDDAGEVTLEGEEEGEGRTCHNCHGGGSVGHHDATTYQEVQLAQDHTGGGWGFGFGGIGIFALPLVGLNIAVVVLLAIILKHLVHISEAIHSDYDDYGTPVYTGYTSYQAYDNGGVAANTYGGAANSYGQYRRKAETSRNMAAEPSTMEYLAKFVKNSIEKYSKVENEQ